MRDVLKRGAFNGLCIAAVVLAAPLGWRLGILIGSGHWLPLGDINFPQR